MSTTLQFLNAIYPLSIECNASISQMLRTREIAKKEFLLRAGHICRNIYFIQKGLLRCFYHKEENEISSWFMKEGDIIISVESFFQQKNSYESIQAMEDCLLDHISYNELQYLYRTFPEFNFIGRMLTEKYYSLSEQRLYSMRMQRSQERYDYLLEHHPELALRVPAKHLATYLGITESHFSHIKGKK